MPCPYFLPTERADDLGWPHRYRLPLGDGWKGKCCASSEAKPASDAELTNGCNLGYARECGRLPQAREADAVRFSVTRDRDGAIHLFWLTERDHLPVKRGELVYQVAEGTWTASAPSPVLQAQAEAFLAGYLARRRVAGAAAAAAT